MVHGARRPETIKRGADHPGYKHGKYTNESKAEDRRKLYELHQLEEFGHAIGLLVGNLTRGRKPKKPE